MSFIGRTLAMAHREVVPFTPSTYDDAYPLQFWGDRAISPETAMTLSIAYACTRVVSEDIGKVPLQIYENLGNDRKQVARDHEWYDALHSQSNEFQTAIEFREMMTAWALNRGRGIAEKTTRRVRMRGGLSVIRRELIPLHPSLIHRKMVDDGSIVYEYADPKTKKVRRLLSDELLIVRGFNNLGVIELARRSFESMLARQGFETSMWRKGPRHAGVIQRPKDAPKWNDTNRRVFREAIEEYEQGGDREGRPLLLEDGMTWTNSSFSMVDTQFVESGMASAEEGCRWYRVPQHKVQLLSRSTNNNIEQQSRDYISDSLQSWAVRWDQSIQRDCLAAPFFSRHNLDAISQRGNTKERAEAQVTYVNGGIKTQDEIRIQEDMNPMGGEAATLRRAVDAQAPAKEPAEPADASPDEPPAARGARTADTDMIQRSALMSKVRAFSQDAASRVWNRERATLAKLAEKTDGKGKEWLDGVSAFYHDYPAFVARAMRCTPEAAEGYCRDRRALVWAGGAAALDDEDTSPVAELIELAIQPSLVLQLVTGADA
jgi:HK97 family phage portal protein